MASSIQKVSRALISHHSLMQVQGQFFFNNIFCKPSPLPHVTQYNNTRSPPQGVE